MNTCSCRSHHPLLYRIFLVGSFLLAAASCLAAPKSLVLLPAFPNPTPQTDAVLFSFDALAFPDSQGVARTMLRGTPSTCLRPGPANAPDQRLAYYGTVVRVASDDFRMWYLG